MDIPICGGRYTGKFYTFHGLADSLEHVAIALGDWEKAEVPLVRIHSECLTGDVFGSQKCDCGEQLEESLELIHRAGGVLIYLRQEGRGIGLYNKLATYVLQQNGMNTFEANEALGFELDQRDYTAAAQILVTLGIQRINLLTNNPFKAAHLREKGIAVERTVTTGVFLNPHNHAYLSAKAAVGGHSIVLAGGESDRTPLAD